MAIPFLDQPAPLVSWLLAGAAVLVIGIAKSGFGGGVGLLAVPLFVMAVGSAPVAVGAMLPLLLAGDVMSAIHHRGYADRRLLGMLLPGFAAGTAAGALLIFLFQETARAERALEIVIGLVCIGYFFADRAKNRWASEWALEPGWRDATAVGAIAGFVSTLAHTAGPVIAIFLLAQKLPKRVFVATSVFFFLLGNAIKLPPYGALGLIDWSTLRIGLWLVPLVPLGTLAGFAMHKRMNERVFHQVILWIILLSGVQLLVGTDVIRAALAGGA